jgi:excinuclease ABC subunit A
LVLLETGLLLYLSLKTRGYKPGRFSFNVKGGRCEACEGDGVITYEMHFLPDVYIQCDECKGTRYNRETLEIKFKDKSIADVLNMTVDEGCEYFENISNIKSKLLTLKKSRTWLHKNRSTSYYSLRWRSSKN